MVHAGTFENKLCRRIIPIIRGKNLRIHCADCWEGSSEGGLMIFWETYWETTSSTGRTRYAEASCHPMGGAPFTRGNSQLPAPCQTCNKLMID